MRRNNGCRKAWPKAVAIGWLVASLSGAHADSVEGFLDRSTTHSVLWQVSEESGDLLGLVFQNQSPGGRRILSQCLSQMVCRIDGDYRPTSGSRPWSFSENPAGWLELTKVRSAEMVSRTERSEAKTKTRYGQLAIDGDGVLRLNGRVLDKAIAGNNSLLIIGKFEFGSNDVVVLQNLGGSACPALYRFVTLGAQGFRASKEFGSCSDVVVALQFGEQIRVSMPDFSGPFEDKPEGRSTLRRVDYVYEKGKVTVNGKPL